MFPCRFNLDHRKVRIIDDVAANDKFGLSTRFKACLLAKTPWVFIQDDDHYMKVRLTSLHKSYTSKCSDTVLYLLTIMRAEGQIITSVNSYVVLL